jgi:predicted transglutaminase-like cysteine proteinase
MKDFKLRNIFNTAVLAGLTALSTLTECGVAFPTAPAASDTQLVLDATVHVNVDQGKWSVWKDRQDYYLSDDSNRVHYQAWLAQLDDAKDFSLLEKANRVNDLVNNTVTWVSDRDNYGRWEYFASGVQTVLSGRGDCEDFAIAKLYALQYLNVPENRVLILCVATDGVSEQPNHGVLAVDTSAANNWINCLILNDNEIRPENFMKPLGRTGYAPRIAFNAEEIRSCKLKVLKTPAP